MINILCQGGWHVGQSALLDWLDGFEEISLVSGENEYLRKENGVFDLLAENNISEKLKILNSLKLDAFSGIYHSLVSYSSFLFKKKFAKSQFTDEIVSRWERQKKVFRYISFNTSLCHYVSVEQRKLLYNKPFDEMAHWGKWLSYINHIGSKKKKANLYVQHNPFFYKEIIPNHEGIWQKFFEPFKIIFVYRDFLMDQFSDFVTYKSYIPFAHRSYYGTEHLHAADRYFELIKRIYLARLRMAKEYSPDQLIVLSFEDFLQNHQAVTAKLKSFLSIKSERDPYNKRFILEQSMKNIGNGKNNTEALSWLEGRPHIMKELYELKEQLANLPHAIH
jgi:hypothetical protein